MLFSTGASGRRKKRDLAKGYYKSRGAPCELHYIDISDDTWKANLYKRDSVVNEGKTSAYYVDDNHANKFESIFIMPGNEEYDLRYKNDWIETCPKE